VFNIILKDKQTFQASCIEEQCRAESDGNIYPTLVIQNSSISSTDSAEKYTNILTVDNISEITVCDEDSPDVLLATISGYKFIRFITTRVTKSGILLTINLTKQDLNVFSAQK